MIVGERLGRVAALVGRDVGLARPAVAQQASSQTTTLGDLLTAKLGRKQGGDD